MIAFIDSSVIIEFVKQNLYAQKLVAKIQDTDILIITPIIISEVAYILHQKAHIPLIDIITYLGAFEVKYFSDTLIEIWHTMMQKYGLKPNDASILATCKYYDITTLISLDTDFTIPCQQESITLINA